MAKKYPGNYSDADVLYAKLVLSRLKKEKILVQIT